MRKKFSFLRKKPLAKESADALDTNAVDRHATSQSCSQPSLAGFHRGVHRNFPYFHLRHDAILICLNAITTLISIFPGGGRDLSTIHHYFPEGVTGA
jgi:hypothetical protein